jgi:hypothetical protein
MLVGFVKVLHFNHQYLKHEVQHEPVIHITVHQTKAQFNENIPSL